MITEFIDGATLEHLRYRDCIVPWPLERVITLDGKLLAYHYAHQALDGRDAQSKKRSYVCKLRSRKKPQSNVSRRDTALSPESILSISTKLCCKRKCCQYFDCDLALVVRERYWDKTF